MNSEDKNYGFISAYDTSKKNDKYGFVPQNPFLSQDHIEENGFFENLKDYGKTVLKGSIEGISKLGRIMGPLEIGKTDKQIFEEQSKALNALLPTDEEFGQKSIRRGLNIAPSMIAFPGSPIQAGLRSLVAGSLGQTAEELDLPEWAQEASELTAFIGPDLAKKLLESGKNGKLIQFAKKMGMTDEQIAPLLQSDFKQKWLSKLSPKRGSTQTTLSNTKQALDEIYGNIQKSETAAKEISEQNNGILINELMQMINDMPEVVRSKIEPDLNRLLENKITGNRLIDFYKDINHYVSDNAKQLSLLKKPIKKALSSISPELGNDFELTNELYTKYYPIAGRLKPNLFSDIVSAGHALGVGAGSLGIMFGMYPPLLTIVGKAAANKLAQQMLLNPRLQQISRKMVTALNNNKFGVAQKLAKSFGNQIEKYSPKVAKELQNISEKDFEELFNQKEKDQKESK